MGALHLCLITRYVQGRVRNLFGGGGIIVFFQRGPTTQNSPGNHIFIDPDGLRHHSPPPLQILWITLKVFIGTDYFPQNLIIWSLYLSNLMVYIYTMYNVHTMIFWAWLFDLDLAFRNKNFKYLSYSTKPSGFKMSHKIWVIIVPLWKVQKYKRLLIIIKYIYLIHFAFRI